jgi:hypothetical protein
MMLVVDISGSESFGSKKTNLRKILLLKLLQRWRFRRQNNDKID